MLVTSNNAFLIATFKYQQIQAGELKSIKFDGLHLGQVENSL